jgi:2-keto-myo-inositol isomerase
MDKIESMLKEDTLANTGKQLEKQNLEVASINGPENFNLIDDHALSDLLTRTDKIVETAKDFDCQLIIPVPSPAKDGVSQEAAIAQTATTLAKMADRYGDEIKLGLEFLGMRSCSINNLHAAIDIVKRVGKSNVGLVLDTFHMFVSNSKFSEITESDSKLIFLAHVNDSEPGDKSKLTDANRLYPGEGVIDLKEFFRELNRVGYDDCLSLELLRPAYWDEPPEQVAMKGRESLRRVFGV